MARACGQVRARVLLALLAVPAQQYWRSHDAPFEPSLPAGERSVARPTFGLLRMLVPSRNSS